MKLTRLYAREIIDSRGNPTVEVQAEAGEFKARAMVPSGASTGVHEALELRDNDSRRFNGKGVLKAIDNINKILARNLKGANVTDQRAIDATLIGLDGTPNKSNLGANATLGVSLAVAHLGAAVQKVELFEHIATISKRSKANVKPRLLPLPMMNIINGGAHANSGLEFQEMMICPVGAATIKEAVRMGCEVFHALKKILGEQDFPTSVGDEGGFAPQLGSHERALDTILEAIKKAGYKAGSDIMLALDVAASEFFDQGSYKVTVGGKQQTLNSKSLIAYYAKLVNDYPIFSIEDGCAEDDWAGWQHLTEQLGKKVQLVGDDLFVTNQKRLTRGIESHVGNSILIKPNQIGTLTETIDVIDQAKEAKYTTIISHRSGETEDTTIAHLAVGMESGQIKTGSLSRSERIAKYNELMRIEEILGRRGRFAGKPR